jgi:hypothetical protein
LVLGGWENADKVVASDGLGGRPGGPDVGAVGLGCPVAAAVAAIDAAKGFDAGPVGAKGFVPVVEGPNAEGPLPPADVNPVNGFGAPNAEVLDPKDPPAGWIGCPNALVVVD